MQPPKSRYPRDPVRYTFAQAFGERGPDQDSVVQDADIISAVQFNHSGEMIATGDKGGRIVLLHRIDPRFMRKKHRGLRRQRDTRTQHHSAHRAAQGAGGAGNRYSHASPGYPEDGLDYDDDENDGEDSDDPDRSNDPNSQDPNDPDAAASAGLADPPEFRFWTQFQSHEPEFDYLKSMEIEEKINQIRWVRQVNSAHRIIATNDKTVKLWRVQETETRAVAEFSSDAFLPHLDSGAGASAAQAHARGKISVDMRLPLIEKAGPLVMAHPRRIFTNAHAYHINSVSINSDQETFISADDLRVNLWHLNHGGVGFNIIDIKPGNMEELSEVITAAEFHPSHCNLLMHSSSKGVVKLVDLRVSALCEGWAKEFEEPEDPTTRDSFFSEIITSISDVKFSPDGRYILTRDYMNLKLWDINMEREPVLCVPVHEHLRSRLCDLYENDCVFDKFQCAFSHDGGSIITGSYNGLFESYATRDGTCAAIEASVDFISGVSGRLHYSAQALAASLIAGSSVQELVDPTRRIMHLHADPENQVSAVASGPALYIYHA